jgi:hypothetical protein
VPQTATGKGAGFEPVANACRSASRGRAPALTDPPAPITQQRRGARSSRPQSTSTSASNSPLRPNNEPSIVNSVRACSATGDGELGEGDEGADGAGVGDDEAMQETPPPAIGGYAVGREAGHTGAVVV